MRNRTIVALLVVGLIVGGAAGYLIGRQPTPPPLRSSATDEDWKFVVSVSPTAIESGQPLLLVANLTNISPENQTIRPYVDPFINPQVIAANGTVVWGWDPPMVTWLNTNVTSGQSLSQQVLIPTTHLQTGNYQIEVAPLSSQFPNYFNITLNYVSVE